MKWKLTTATKHHSQCHIFPVIYRQRGSGFGALAAGIGIVALPLARRIIWPAAKRIGQELLVQGAPELVEVATKRKSAKQALKNRLQKQPKNNLVVLTIHA